MDKRVKMALRWLILVSFLIRAVLAGITGLGNDEVYYVLYARFPDMSHFDHPPMVGYFIQLFTLNLTLHDVFFVRLAAVITGTANTFLVFMIAKQLRDEFAGLYAAMLYTASFYAFVICGVFIMPDTPMSFFWLLSVYFLLASLSIPDPGKDERRNLILAGLSIGLCMLSKYHGVLLWLGAGLYILAYSRKWLKRKELYISLLVSLLVFAPVLIWNFMNGFVSFGFQGSRAAGEGFSLEYESFLAEIAGEILYNNPVVFLVCIITLIAIIRDPSFVHRNVRRLLLLTGLPVILIFMVVSLLGPTLPHWSAPGYFSLIILAALYLGSVNRKSRLIPGWIGASLIILLLSVFSGALLINTGFVKMNRPVESVTEKGTNDITLDMYGWDQMADKFGEIYRNDTLQGIMSGQVFMLSYRWFPGAHTDYYLATPNGLKTYVWSDLDNMHKFFWINRIQGEPPPGSSAYYVVTSRDFRAPGEDLVQRFRQMLRADTVPVYRCGNVAEYMFIYRLTGLRSPKNNP